MEEPANLLEDIVPPEPDSNDYKNSYAHVRLITLCIMAFTFVLYTVFLDDTIDEEKNIAYRIGSAFGVVLIISIPSSLIAALLAAVTVKTFSYIERFKKLFWFTALWLASFLALCMCIGVASEKNLF